MGWDKFKGDHEKVTPAAWPTWILEPSLDICSVPGFFWKSQIYLSFFLSGECSAFHWDSVQLSDF
jgi:hypothetical protein